ncbi:UNVERIFIED_CONTAM: hypothetical protein GTU68_049497 [Idotea baltica]|nr:hypothetical protein [Idotea baltica]
MYKFLFSITVFCFAFSSCSTQKANAEKQVKDVQQTEKGLNKYSKAYFAAGCFWCVEAVFESVEGVAEAVSGYSGGIIKNPTYEQIGTGRLKHAEAVEVYYDKEVISFETLVKVFFGSQNPTTLNRQGPDSGPQYRSIAFYNNAEEKIIIENYIKQLTEEAVFDQPIVTEVKPFDVFYDAEDYHQNYEKLNPSNPYVQKVSIPRLNRFKKKFPELLKEGERL